MDSATRDLCDFIMQPYEKSDVRNKEQELIAQDIFILGNQLSPEQKVRFIALLDRINNADSQAYYEAFEKGMLVALHCLIKSN